MTLYLIRHGKAETNADGGDSERRLAQRGTFQSAMVARLLKKMGVEFDRIISSPYIRARETADIVARVTDYNLKNIHEDKRLTPMGRFEDVSALLAENSDAESLLIAGHEPSMSEFISGITAQGHLEILVKTAAITAIEIHQLRPHARGTLLWSLPPNVIEPLT